MLTVNPSLSLGTLSAPQLIANQPYSAMIPISGGTGVYSNASVTGLPTGLSASLSGNTITFTGTTPQAGTFSNIVVSVQDSTGAKASAIDTLTVAPASSLTLGPSSWSSVTAGLYDTAIGTITATGGYGQYSYFVASDPLSWPQNIYVSNTGILTVWVTTAGTYNFTVEAIDLSQNNLTGTKTYTLTVSPSAVSSFVVSAPVSATAGNSFGVTITAKDWYGNTVTNYNGPVTSTITLISGAGQTVTVPQGVVCSNGTATVNVNFNTANTEGTFTFTSLAWSINDRSSTEQCSLTIAPNFGNIRSYAVNGFGDVVELSNAGNLFEFNQGNAVEIASGIQSFAINGFGDVVAWSTSGVLSEFTQPAGGAIQIGTGIQSFAINGLGHVVALNASGVLTEFTQPGGGAGLPCRLHSVFRYRRFGPRRRVEHLQRSHRVHSAGRRRGLPCRLHSVLRYQRFRPRGRVEH